MRAIPAVKEQAVLVTTRAKIIANSLSLVNHASRAHRPNGSPNAPSSRLRAPKLCCILPILVNSQDGRTSRTTRFRYAEHGHLAVILSWLVDNTKGTVARLRAPARQLTDDARFERATSACQPQWGTAVAARGLLAELRAPGSEGTWTIVKAKIPEIRPKSDQKAAVTASVSSVTEP